jgi:hypothetical protein
MFNIVKRRDFILADDLPTREETQRLCDEKYGLITSSSRRRNQFRAPAHRLTADHEW